MSEFTDIFWPRLDPDTEVDRYKDEKRYIDDINKIEEAHWDPIEPVLEQARILDLREENRNKTAETKASIYLAALIAFSPLTATVIVQIYNSFQGWQLFILTFLFFLVVIYFMRAIFWALKAIKPAPVDRVDVIQLCDLYKNNKNAVVLCKNILKAVRTNWKFTNIKIDSVNMAHENLRCLLFSFVLLLIVAGSMKMYPMLHEFFAESSIQLLKIKSSIPNN